MVLENRPVGMLIRRPKQCPEARVVTSRNHHQPTKIDVGEWHTRTVESLDDALLIVQYRRSLQLKIRQ